MDFWDRIKSSFKTAVLGGIKRKLIIALIVIVSFILLITIITVVYLKENESNLDTDESLKTIGNNFVVNTSVSDAKLIITDRNVLIDAINSLGISQDAKTNLISQVDTFLNIQNIYHVNAVFCAAVPIVESSAGTAWDLISPVTNNWVSIKGTKGGGYVDIKGTSWNVYSNFGESSMDMAELMLKDGMPYFDAGNNTVSTIAEHYCPGGDWDKQVIDYMTQIYEAAGIEVSSISITGNAIVDTAAELYMQMYVEDWGYNQSCHANANLILENNYCEKWNGGHYHTKLTDCSSFVCRVLQRLGYNISLTTAGLVNFDPSAYGLDGICEVIHYNGRSVDANFFKPGDIVVGRWGDSGHVNIVGAVQNGYTYVYDAGAESNWMKHQGQMWPYNSHWQDSSVIIRFVN